MRDYKNINKRRKVSYLNTFQKCYGWRWITAGTVFGIGMVGYNYFSTAYSTIKPVSEIKSESAPIVAKEKTDEPKDMTYTFYSVLPKSKLPEALLLDAQLDAPIVPEQVQSVKHGVPPPQITHHKVAERVLKPKEEPLKSAVTVKEKAISDNLGGRKKYLQVGAFADFKKAQRLKIKLTLLNYSVRIKSAKIGDRTLYRVHTGPFQSPQHLMLAKHQLNEKNIQAIVIQR